MNPVRLATRGSALAVTQSRWVAERIEQVLGAPTELVRIQTSGDRLRDELNRVFADAGLPLSVTGMGSMNCLRADEPRLVELLFLHLVERGLFIAPRGFIALSMEITDDHTAALVDAVQAWAWAAGG